MLTSTAPFLQDYFCLLLHEESGETKQNIVYDAYVQCELRFAAWGAPHTYCSTCSQTLRTISILFHLGTLKK